MDTETMARAVSTRRRGMAARRHPAFAGRFQEAIMGLAAPSLTCAEP